MSHHPGAFATAAIVPLLFRFAEFWRAYVAFTAFVLRALAARRSAVLHRKAHVVSFRESKWLVDPSDQRAGAGVQLRSLSAAVSLIGARRRPAGRARIHRGIFIVERSLAFIDNIFVFVLCVQPLPRCRRSISTASWSTAFLARSSSVPRSLRWAPLSCSTSPSSFDLWCVSSRWPASKLLWSPDQEIEPEKKNPLDQAVPAGWFQIARLFTARAFRVKLRRAMARNRVTTSSRFSS